MSTIAPPPVPPPDPHSTANDLVQTASAFRRQLMAGEQEAAQTLTGYYQGAWETISSRLEALTDKMQDALDNGEELTPAWLARQKALEQLLADVESEIDYFAQAAAGVVAKQKAEAAKAGQQFAQQAMRATVPPGVHWDFSAASLSAIEHLAGRLEPGSPVHTVLSTMGSEAAAGAKQALMSGIVQGLNPRETARGVQEALQVPMSQALTISRTEQIDSYRDAAIDNYRDNSDVVGAWIWIADLSTNTCGECLAMNGSMHSLDEYLDSHPNCRCSPIPYTNDWQDILSDDPDFADIDLSDLPDTRPDVESGEDWFARQNPQAQRRILGPGKAALYQTGQIKLADLVGVSHSKEYGTTRYEKSMKEMGFSAADVAAAQADLRKSPPGGDTSGPNAEAFNARLAQLKAELAELERLLAETGRYGPLHQPIEQARIREQIADKERQITTVRDARVADAMHPDLESLRDATTVPALRDWLATNLPQVEAHLSGLSGKAGADYLRPGLEALGQMARDYPEVAARIEMLGLVGDPQMREYLAAFPQLSDPELMRKFVAGQFRMADLPGHQEDTGTGILITPQMSRVLGRIGEIERQIGYWQPGTTDLGSVITHEFGHVMEDWLSEHPDPAIRQAYADYLQTLYSHMTPEEAVSGRALENVHEMFAEAFDALYHGPDRLRDLSYVKELQQLLDRAKASSESVLKGEAPPAVPAPEAPKPAEAPPPAPEQPIRTLADLAREAYTRYDRARQRFTAAADAVLKATAPGSGVSAEELARLRQARDEAKAKMDQAEAVSKRASQAAREGEEPPPGSPRLRQFATSGAAGAAPKPDWLAGLEEIASTLRIAQGLKEKIQAIRDLRQQLDERYGAQPEFQALARAVRDWTDPGNPAAGTGKPNDPVRVLQREMDAIVAGKPGSPEAAALLRAIQEGGPTTRELLRGEHSAKPRSFTAGQMLDLRPNSWSDDEHMAQEFGARAASAKEPNVVLYHLEPGARAAAISPLSEMPEEREYITGGRFRVERVETHYGATEVYLRQIEPYGASTHAIAAPTGPVRLTPEERALNKATIAANKAEAKATAAETKLARAEDKVSAEEAKLERAQAKLDVLEARAKSGAKLPATFEDRLAKARAAVDAAQGKVEAARSALETARTARDAAQTAAEQARAAHETARTAHAQAQAKAQAAAEAAAAKAAREAEEAAKPQAQAARLRGQLDASMADREALYAQQRELLQEREQLERERKQSEDSLLMFARHQARIDIYHQSLDPSDPDVKKYLKNAAAYAQATADENAARAEMQRLERLMDRLALQHKQGSPDYIRAREDYVAQEAKREKARAAHTKLHGKLWDTPRHIYMPEMDSIAGFEMRAKQMGLDFSHIDEHPLVVAAKARIASIPGRLMEITTQLAALEKSIKQADRQVNQQMAQLRDLGGAIAPAPETLDTMQPFSATVELPEGHQPPNRMMNLLDYRMHEPRQVVKRRIITSIADRLKENPAWQAYVDRSPMPNLGETYHAYVPDYADAHDGKSAQLVADLIKRWGVGYKPGSRQWVAMQMAVAEEFGLDATIHAVTDAQRQAGEAYYAENGEALRAFMRAMYDNTQAWFAEHGITEVDLYRGYGWRADSPAVPDNVEWGPMDAQHYGTVDNFELNPFQSWSADINISQGTGGGGGGFAGGGFAGGSDYSLLIGARVPVDRILSTAQTGFGAKLESEIVVMGRAGDTVSYRAGTRVEEALLRRAEEQQVSDRETLYTLPSGATVRVAVNPDGTYTVTNESVAQVKGGVIHGAHGGIDYMPDSIKPGKSKTYKTLQAVNKALKALRIANTYTPPQQ